MILPTSYVILVFVVILWVVVLRAHFLGRNPSSPDKCRHRRWTKWKVEGVKAVHIYNEFDEGRELPDRVDAYMTRTCLKCGIPQAQTVRGIDSTHFK